MTENASFDIDYENLDDLPLYEHIEWRNKGFKLFSQGRNKLAIGPNDKRASKKSPNTHLPFNASGAIGS